LCEGFFCLPTATPCHYWAGVVMLQRCHGCAITSYSAHHGVLLAQVREQRRQRRQAMADGHAAQGALHQVVALSDDVGADHGAEFFRLHDVRAVKHDYTDVYECCDRFGEYGRFADKAFKLRSSKLLTFVRLELLALLPCLEKFL
jgi:hypothetical protein